MSCRQRVTAALLVATGLCLLPGPLRSEPSAPGFPPDASLQLAPYKELYVATERKDGTRSAAVPVWFAVIDNAVWFATSPKSHKGQRVGRGSPMYISTAGKDGPFIKTNAEIVKDGAMADRLGDAYRQKYWMAWAGFYRPSRAKLDAGEIVLLRLTPAP